MDNPFDTILAKLNEIDTKISSIPQSPATALPEIIDTAEVCRRLAISEPSLRKCRAKKKIPSFKIGAGVRYNWPAVVEALEKPKQKA